jgi:hypothetical protein
VSRALRVINPDGGEALDYSMAEAIQAVANKIIAAKPVAVFLAWETQDKDNGSKLTSEAIPFSTLTAKGFIDELYWQLHPEVSE